MSTAWPQLLELSNNYNRLAYLGSASSSSTTLALDSAYTYASAGDAIMAMAFISPETANLTDIWFYVVSYTGTWANTDGNINWEIREGLNGTRIPGTTLTASGTFTLNGSTTGWHRITGLAVALTAGKMYCLVLADADGGASDYVTLQVKWGIAGEAFGVTAGAMGTTANGFASAFTNVAGEMAGAIKIGTRTIAGQIFNTISTVTSGTYERGCRFRPKENCSFIGWGITTDFASLINGNTLKLYADGVNPGGSTLASIGPGATTRNSGTAPIPTSLTLPAASFVDLDADTWYRAVIDLVSAGTTPRKMTYPGSPDSTLLAAAMPMAGDCYWTEESGGVWSNDTAAVPLIGPILVPRRTASGGGGGPFHGPFG